ncbi:MAG: hypothetical protein EBR79_01730 [Proteobacteria bacterium]|nr:hypothetical protein [Pseudomonadota bacterium]
MCQGHDICTSCLVVRVGAAERPIGTLVDDWRGDGVTPHYAQADGAVAIVATYAADHALGLYRHWPEVASRVAEVVGYATKYSMAGATAGPVKQLMRQFGGEAYSPLAASILADMDAMQAPRRQLIRLCAEELELQADLRRLPYEQATFAENIKKIRWGKHFDWMTPAELRDIDHTNMLVRQPQHNRERRRRKLAAELMAGVYPVGIDHSNYAYRHPSKSRGRAQFSAWAKALDKAGFWAPLDAKLAALPHMIADKRARLAAILAEKTALVIQAHALRDAAGGAAKAASAMPELMAA